MSFLFFYFLFFYNEIDALSESPRPYGSADPEHLARMSAASEMFLIGL